MLDGESGIGPAVEHTLYPAIRGEYLHEARDYSKIEVVPGTGYLLPGYGLSRSGLGRNRDKYCGDPKFRLRCEVGCDNDQEPKYARHHCGRQECPVCYHAWATRRARFATERVEQTYNLTNRHYRPRHFEFSFPFDSKLSYTQMFTKVSQIIKEYSTGLCGGVIIGHPWRFRDSRGERVAWKHCSLNMRAEEPIVESTAVYGPHFHVIMYGWIAPSPEVYAKTGLSYKNLSRLPKSENVHRAIYYALTHCGVESKRHALRWFGIMGYNQLRNVTPEHMVWVAVLCECGSRIIAYNLDGKRLGPYEIRVKEYKYLFKEQAIPYLEAEAFALSQKPQTFDIRRKGRWANNE